MMEKSNLIFGIGGAVLGGLMGFGIIKDLEMKKLDEFNEKFDASVKRISKLPDISVEERLVEEAVNQAVDREVKRAVTRTVDNIRDDTDRTVRSLVKNEVNDSAESIRERVSKEIARQAAEIDVDDLKKDVVKEAKKAAMKKFDGCLDEQAEKFGKDLANISRVYEKLAEKIPDKNENSSLFSVTLL